MVQHSVPEINELRVGLSQSWGKGHGQHTTSASTPHRKSNAGPARQYLLIVGRENEKREKSCKHLNFKSIHGAFCQKKKMYRESRFENHRLLGFEANPCLSTAESHSCPINFQEVD